MEVRPELAKRVDVTPDGSGWLHEVKYDGYRIIAQLQNGHVRLKTRNDLEWTDRFPDIAAALAKLSARTAVLDGEVVVLNEHGLSDFSALQNKLSKKAKKGFLYLAFDLLFLNGVDIREVPLLGRKKLLQALLRRQSRFESNKSRATPVRFANHEVGHGDKVFQNACHRGFEGIISKRVDSPYWTPADSKASVRAALRGGSLKFELFGEKLRGRWALVRMRKAKQNNAWLLIKEKEARPKKVRESVKLTRRSKVLYPEAGITKNDLAEYYLKASTRMLPHVEGRPLMILRCPDGRGENGFFQKKWNKGLPRRHQKGERSSRRRACTALDDRFAGGFDRTRAIRRSGASHLGYAL